MYSVIINYIMAIKQKSKRLAKLRLSERNAKQIVKFLFLLQTQNRIYCKYLHFI